ncbi:hypothetical protein Trydic_g3811 [Trypoxylus dichotomus]
MDFFCDEQPRSAPKPLAFDQVSSCKLIATNNCYNAWKAKVIQNLTPTKPQRMLDKENVALNNEGGTEKESLSKHVRFDGPGDVQKHALKGNNIKRNPKDVPHMKNVPNRSLDLSVIDNVPRQKEEDVKQVATLIENQVVEQKQSGIPNYVSQQRITRQQKCINSAKIEHAQFNHLAKRTFPHLAVNVMTSFEVHASQTTTNNQHNTEEVEVILKDMEAQKVNFDKKQSDKEEENDQRQCRNFSLSLNEPLVVVERCPSSEDSIHVDMRDYSSSDSENETTTNSSMDVGWSVYNNIMAQVSHMLKNAENVTDHTDGGLSTAQILDDRTLQTVREATVRHLKRIGVNLATEEDYDLKCLNGDESTNSVYSPSEISFAVRQLLMKYLPNDQLLRLARTDMNRSKKSSDCNRTNFVARRRPEFSFATIQYMKKYNLLTSDSMLPPQAVQPNRKCANTPFKILDVTVLKQQPKLL